MKRREFITLLGGTVASLFGGCSAAIAQAYPARSIRLVVPFPPGGAFDFVGRPWAEKIKSSLGNIVVENIGGGGSSLGAAAVVRSPLAWLLTWRARKQPQASLDLATFCRKGDPEWYITLGGAQR